MFVKISHSLRYNGNNPNYLIFSIRIAGNTLNEDAPESIESAMKVVGTKIIVIFGNTKCGAIVGGCNLSR